METKSFNTSNPEGQENLNHSSESGKNNESKRQKVAAAASTAAAVGVAGAAAYVSSNGTEVFNAESGPVENEIPSPEETVEAAEQVEDLAVEQEVVEAQPAVAQDVKPQPAIVQEPQAEASEPDEVSFIIEEPNETVIVEDEIAEDEIVFNDEEAVETQIFIDEQIDTVPEQEDIIAPEQDEIIASEKEEVVAEQQVEEPIEEVEMDQLNADELLKGESLIDPLDAGDKSFLLSKGLIMVGEEDTLAWDLVIRMNDAEGNDFYLIDQNGDGSFDTIVDSSMEIVQELNGDITLDDAREMIAANGDMSINVGEDIVEVELDDFVEPDEFLANNTDENSLVLDENDIDEDDTIDIPDIV